MTVRTGASFTTVGSADDEGKPALFEVVLAKRMPHALDLRQLELAWQFMKRFSRGKDGALDIATRNAAAAKRPDALRPQQMGGMEKKRRGVENGICILENTAKANRMKE